MEAIGASRKGMSTQKAKFKKTNLQLLITRVQQLHGRRVWWQGGSVTQITGVPGASNDTVVVSSDCLDVKDRRMYNTRFFYNSRVVPSKVDPLLARKCHRGEILGSNIVRSRIFSRVFQSSMHAVSRVAPKCTNSLNAGQ